MTASPHPSARPGRVLASTMMLAALLGASGVTGARAAAEAEADDPAVDRPLPSVQEIARARAAAG